MSNALTFDLLRAANLARLPVFKNRHGAIAHARPDGSDWTPAQWLQAVMGELGEFANVRKKFERGDLTFEKYRIEAAKELADVQVYFDILCARALDRVQFEEIAGACESLVRVIAHPDGINLGEATRAKFNEVSVRVDCNVRL